MSFFFDANISIRICKMLAAYAENEHAVVHITQHDDFLHNNHPAGGNTTPDEEFLRVLPASGRDWKIISGDSRIINTAHQKAALIASGLTYFCLDRNWTRARASEQAWKIVKIWDDIVRLAAQPGQAIYAIHMGKKMWIETIESARQGRGKTRRK